MTAGCRRRSGRGSRRRTWVAAAAAATQAAQCSCCRCCVSVPVACLSKLPGRMARGAVKRVHLAPDVVPLACSAEGAFGLAPLCCASDQSPQPLPQMLDNLAPRGLRTLARSWVCSITISGLTIDHCTCDRQQAQWAKPERWRSPPSQLCCCKPQVKPDIVLQQLGDACRPANCPAMAARWLPLPSPAAVGGCTRSCRLAPWTGALSPAPGQSSLTASTLMRAHP